MVVVASGQYTFGKQSFSLFIYVFNYSFNSLWNRFIFYFLKVYSFISFIYILLSQLQVLKIIMNDRKSIKEFKTYWSYSWGNFPGKIHSIKSLFHKKYFPREKAVPLSVLSNLALFSRELFPMLPVYFPFFLWNSCFSSGCLLNSPPKNTVSHFAIREVRTV